MEYGSIEREIHVDAPPEVVYEVVSAPEHVRQWWPDDAEFVPVPGGSGVISFGGESGSVRHVVPITVLETDPPRRFVFRWAYEPGEDPAAGNSFLVTFELKPSGTGTLLRLTETGFRERGWEVAVLEEHFRDHVTGWDFFLPRLVPYVAGLVSAP